MKLEYYLVFTPEESDPEMINVEGRGSLDGVITFGQGMEEAMANAQEALTAFLASLVEHGEPIPRPTEAQPSGEAGRVFAVEPEPEVAIPILLRWAREEAHLTQGDVAKRLGVSYQAYQKLERPGANPTIKTMKKAARVLGWELELGLAAPRRGA